MSVQQRSDAIQHRDWELAEQAWIKGLSLRPARDESLFGKAIPEISNLMPLGAPPVFKLFEALIFQVGPSKTKRLESLAAEPLDGFPQD